MDSLTLVSSPKLVLGHSPSNPRHISYAHSSFSLPLLFRKPRKFIAASQSGASPRTPRHVVETKLGTECFASISSSSQGTSSVGVNPQFSPPPPSSNIGSPLFWIGVGVGLSALFSWVASNLKKYAMQQAFKTLMGQMDSQNNQFNTTFSPGSPFPFPLDHQRQYPHYNLFLFYVQLHPSHTPILVSLSEEPPMADMDKAKSIHQLNGDLYRALMEKNSKDVLGFLPEDEGPLHKITIHKDTVLHMACYSKQRDLALELLKLLPPSLNDRLTDTKNDVDNTILHEVATNNSMTDVATEILNRTPKLLTARNILGETPLFRAVRYGKDEMFKLLAEKLDRFETEEDRKACLKRNDGTTILHISVFTENFDLALLIAERYGDLISDRDSNQMTALQHLACNPSAFLSGCEHGHLRRFIYSCIVSLFSSPLTGLIKFFWHCFNFHKGFQYVPKYFEKSLKNQKRACGPCLGIALAYVPFDNSKLNINAFFFSSF